MIKKVLEKTLEFRKFFLHLAQLRVLSTILIGFWALESNAQKQLSAQEAKSFRLKNRVFCHYFMENSTEIAH